MDLFGPLEIGLTRNRTAKRWGVLFTCLVTRAVFVDLVLSLGELQEAAEQLYASPEITAHFKKKRIEWTFQPPRTPHFGGAHESLVRSTKRAMYRALEEEKQQWRYPTEDTLRTILFEVAGLLNCRPLTYVSSDPTDIPALSKRLLESAVHPRSACWVV
jgi:transposase InsO family protein